MFFFPATVASVVIHYIVLVASCHNVTTIGTRTGGGLVLLGMVGSRPLGGLYLHPLVNQWCTMVCAETGQCMQIQRIRIRASIGRNAQKARGAVNRRNISSYTIKQVLKDRLYQHRLNNTLFDTFDNILCCDKGGKCQ